VVRVGEAEAMRASAITDGSSRDHRADLTPWMVGPVTAHDRDRPVFLRPLDGIACDTQRISQAVTDVLTRVNDAQPEEDVRLSML